MYVVCLSLLPSLIHGDDASFTRLHSFISFTEEGLKIGKVDEDCNIDVCCKLHFPSFFNFTWRKLVLLCSFIFHSPLHFIHTGEKMKRMSELMNMLLITCVHLTCLAPFTNKERNYLGHVFVLSFLLFIYPFSSLPCSSFPFASFFTILLFLSFLPFIH